LILTEQQAFWFLAVLIATPFPILLFVDTERGKRDGIALAKELARATDVAPAEETEDLLDQQEES
jgi:MFS transporter, UMF1 family